MRWFSGLCLLYVCIYGPFRGRAILPGDGLFFAVCILLRLARFNSELPDRPEYTQSFFVGIPAPAAAFLVLTPIVADHIFQVKWLIDETPCPGAYCGWGRGGQHIAHFNGKTLKVPSHAILPFLAFIALLGAMVAMRPWAVYLGLAGLYLASLPISCLAYLRRRQNFRKRQAASE